VQPCADQGAARIDFPMSFQRITTIAIESGRTDRAWWLSCARHVQQWAEAQRVELRDAIWLLPYSALLPVARRALADLGGWQPRVETLATLRAQLGPRGGHAGPGPDAVLNRLQASQWLRGESGDAGWARGDPRAFRQGVDAVVRCAQALQAAAACRPPAERDAWWDAARGLVSAGQGPGGVERQLARIALEWAASSDHFDLDDLRALRPSAWVLLRAGGAEPLADALLAEAADAGAPGLLLDADPPSGALFAGSLEAEPPAQAICADAESEAQAACAQVLAELHADPTAQVALIAQDREAMRRVRALLDRFGVPVVDDTGWRLATTRAAARLMALLKAAQGLRPGRSDSAAADQRLDWLKGDPLGLAQPEALTLLEARWRGRPLPDEAAAQADALWEQAQARLGPLLGERRRPLAAWLDAVAALCLSQPQEAARWRDDGAGRAVLTTLRLDGPAAGGAWQALARQATMTMDDFVAWVDEVLADASYVPPHDASARVVITPLARALLRPFDAVVFPGADERRLGVAEPQPELIGPALADQLGLDGAAAQREREALAFAQLLRQPRVTLLRRAADGSEPLGASPLVERLRLAWLEAPGGPRELPAVQPGLPVRTLAARPVAPPRAVAGERWPSRLSASAVEALRACPYRFFSRVLLGLGEAEELDREVAKRDYGNWLHAVLWRFHEGRVPGAGLASDRQRLNDAAAAQQAESGLSDGDLLPFLASFEALVEPYLRWLHGREAAGWFWSQGEQERRIEPDELDGIALQGRLDRLDRHSDGRLQLLDYKTGSVAGLKAQLADRSEDTQLAFYAALVTGAGDASPSSLSAAYLAMDDKAAPLELPHPNVGETAVLLVQGLGGELRRLRAGEPMRALGDGELCAHCEARGLCRRDHWSQDVDGPVEDPS
jgi:ATP-dependent helicase/nuclease subunit B